MWILGLKGLMGMSLCMLIAHNFMAIMWRGYFSSWDALENEVNENKSGSICIITVC